MKDDIERVPFKERKLEPVFYSQDGSFKLKEQNDADKLFAEQRQSDIAKTYNELTESNVVETLPIWRAGRTPNSFSVKAQQALNPFLALEKYDNVNIFDIEAVGTPKHMQKKGEIDYFAVTELSFGGTKFTGDEFARSKTPIVSIAVAPGKDEYERMKAQIQQLKKNPLELSSKDIHRSLLDLAKYADASKFESVTKDGGKLSYRGVNYTGITGHARTVSPDTAFTANIAEELMRGLDNLKKYGTPVERAISILRKDTEYRKGKLGGYNIHSYDIPALLSVTEDKYNKEFLQKSYGNSLDFFHAYSAVEKDPFSLTGGSMRQEHIHQHLMKRGQIKTLKDRYLYHLAKDDIQANVEIAGFTTSRIQEFLKGADVEKSSPLYDLTTSRIDQQHLKVGDELFSYQSGFFDRDKHKYNLVANAEGASVKPRWETLDSSLPSHERFVIAEFMKDVSLPGTEKKGYGIRLDSKDFGTVDPETKDFSGKSILLFGETQEELAQQIHGSFLPNEGAIAEALNSLKMKHDASFREYDKMFSEGGFGKMEKFYDILKSGEKKKVSDWKKHVLDKGGSEELAMKFEHMLPRLKAEQPIWDQVMTGLNSTSLDKEQKTASVRTIKQQLDELGGNKVDVEVEGNRYFDFAFNKEKTDKTVFNARNADSIKNAFRSHIQGRRRKDRAGAPEKSYQVARIEELQDLIINNFGFKKKGKEAEKVRSIAEGMVSQVYSGEKIEAALTSMANLVRDEVETKGSSRLARETASVVTEERVSAIEALSKKLPSVIKDSVESAKAHREAKNAMDKDSELGEFARAQDDRIKELFKKNFGPSTLNDVEDVKKAGKMASKYEELLGKILKEYSHDFNTQVRFGPSGNPLLILGDKKAGINLSDVKTYEELISNANLAVVELPGFDEDMKVRYGGNRMAALTKSGSRQGEGVYHSTTVTDALNTLISYSSKAKELAREAEGMGTKNLFLTLRQGMNYRIRQQVTPVPTDAGRKLSYDESKMFEYNNSIAGKVRSSKWDITGFAEAWYRQNEGRLGSKADKIADRAKDQHISFYEAMDQKSRSIAMGGELMDYAQSVTQLSGSMFGMNNNSASRGYVGTTYSDARTYMALGNYYADSVENPHKTVNYRKVDEKVARSVLRRSGRDQDYRLKNSFISSAAYEVLEQAEEIRGVTMQTGYMTDEEIANKLKDKNRIAQYKEWINEARKKKRISPVEARSMIAALDSGMASTSEGLAIMDAEMVKVFNGLDEVRLNVRADDIQLKGTIEKAINDQAVDQGLEKNDWKDKRVMFDKPVFLDEDDLLDDKNRLTVGKYTVNNIKQQLQDSTHFRKGDKISIIGFDGSDPDNKTIIFGRRRRTGHGFKAVTESGFRATMLPMLKEIISDLYGIEGTEQILSHLGGKKGMTDLPSLIRGYDTHIRQQFQGTVDKHENMKGFETEADALSAFYQDVEQTMGIKTENIDGQRVVAHDFGVADGKQLSWEDRKKLSNKWMENLGLSREVFADITMAHDVWSRQGGDDRGKITVKEIDMLRRSYTRAGIVKPGEESAHVDFLKDMVYGDQVEKEVALQQRAFEEKVKAFGEYDRGWKPKEGDAVIDFTAEGFGSMGDINAELRNNVLHVSTDAFEKLPDRTGPNQLFTASDYMRTILNTSNIDFMTEGAKETRKVRDHLLENKGMAYVRLPEFASQEYLPLIDVGRFNAPGELKGNDEVQFLNVLQGHYAKIARKTKQHNETYITENYSADDVAKRKKRLESEINSEIDMFKETLAKSSSNEGMSEIMARRMPMSTQLQFGGVNPALAYEKVGDKWESNGMMKEGEIYLNRKNVESLIGDQAENIAKTWGVDVSSIKGDIKDYVLDNWNDNQTIATTIRYPSIDAGTTQALSIKMSDAVGEGQVVGLRGMAERISGDFDGDNLALFLSHYGIEDDERRGNVLKDLNKLHNADKSKNILMADHLMGIMETDFREKMAKETGLEVDHDDIINVSDRFFSKGGLHGHDVTVGTMSTEDTLNTVQKVLDSSANYEYWGDVKNGLHGLGPEEHQKSIIARATATTIGSADTTRMKMSAAFMSMAEVKYKHFNEAEGPVRYTVQDYIKETAVVDEFLREYSQKAISAKKVEDSAETAVDVIEDLYSMMDKVSSPKHDMDINSLAKDLHERGVFKNAPFLEIGSKGEVYKGTGQEFIKEALTILKGAEETFNDMGMRGSNHSSLLFAASRGVGFSRFENMVQTGEHLPGQDSLNYLTRVAKIAGYENMEKHNELYEKGIVRSHTRRMENIFDRLDDAGDTADLFDLNRRPQGDVVPNGETLVYRTMRDNLNDSFTELMPNRQFLTPAAMTMAGVGGAGFAALWATTALMGGAPTPEGLQEMAPVAPETLGAPPTARVTPNDSGEYLNIQINAKTAQSLNSHDLAAMVNNEVMAMSQLRMQTNVNVQDNSQNIDGNWVQGAVANAMNKGYAY